MPQGFGMLANAEFDFESEVVNPNVKNDFSDIEPAQVLLIEDEQVLPDGSSDDDLEAKPEFSDDIGLFVLKSFQLAESARRNAQEDILLQSERAYHNKYDMASQTELAKRRQESDDSTVYVPYTRTKANIAVAKTYEKMLNTTTKPWGIEPDALTEKEKSRNIIDVRRAKISGVLQEDPEVALEKLNEMDEKEKREKTDAMEEEIAEQMNKGNVFTELAKTILQQHYLGTGVAKFEISVRTESTWAETSPDVWELQEHEIPFPKIKFVSLFDMFFDPYALSIAQSQFVIERHVYKRSDMEGLKEIQEFNEEKILEVIANNTDGNHVDLDYETIIRGINDQDQNTTSSDGRYDVFEYWGELGGDKLIQYGMDSAGLDPLKSYNVECWVVANVTIKLVVNPHQPQKVPYFVVPYQENTHTIYATGISEELFGVQDVLNDVARATINNAAFSHAPITEINVDMLASGEQPPTVLKPRHIFLREGGDAKEEMVRFYQPTENSQVLYNVFEMFNKIGEDATGITSSTEESMPAANTANLSVSMTLSQKNILQRTVVENIDKYLIKPMIEMYYNFNMRWSDKTDIKSPAHITANGVSSIIAKEMRVQQLMAFAQMTNNEADSAIVNRKGVLEELASSLDQESQDLVYSDREIKESSQAKSENMKQATMAQQEGVIDQIKTENQGQIEETKIKGDIDYRKQQLIERSDMLQLLAKEEAQMDAQEWELLKQFKLGSMNQQNTERNTAITQRNTERNTMQQNQARGLPNA